MGAVLKIGFVNDVPHYARALKMRFMLIVRCLVIMCKIGTRQSNAFGPVKHEVLVSGNI